ncbi:hypothetical protein [Leptospira biflexa]|uniref:Uncharacterized protein n=1 Tax=Leptospira biflexa serovar Patoc (strain Patoc 1 / ATCC 23582 / Paris) TaxID=456481 RepID=B0SJL5_LEPBP|nr:hypothetical protein [Leptospira biflexa]ABZ96464.1 Hypothetical protein; putative signal peptide [Leptospira biflexa serovar Patoc strain 'Patoc 1 (Paris)']
MSKIVVVFFLFIGIVFMDFACTKKSKEESNSELLSTLLSQGSPIQSACQRFILTESNCVAVADVSANVCPGLISRLKAQILPQELSTDAVAVLYFDCFSKINLTYNLTKACNQNSFASNSEYRRVQRTGTSSAETSWQEAMNQCGSLENSVPPVDSGLQDTDTILGSDPFQ